MCNWLVIMSNVIRCMVILGCLTSFSALSKDVMYSAVSPEFPKGLHYKYLTYIADKMDMELDVVPMPFARRVVALGHGQIDIMVGMQRENTIQDEIIYIYPSYEKLRHTFFILNERYAELGDIDALQQLSIGVTIHAKYYKKFNENNDYALVAVSSLKQKVALLQKGRIDTFIHYQESTSPYLLKNHLSDKIVMAPYQPTEYHEYYVTISNKSRLLPYQDTLKKIMQQAEKNGDFERLRQQHYAL